LYLVPVDREGIKANKWGGPHMTTGARAKYKPELEECVRRANESLRRDNFSIKEKDHKKFHKNHKIMIQKVFGMKKCSQIQTVLCYYTATKTGKTSFHG
jgi:hypothetical protein